MSNSKRERGMNFSQQEICLLVDLILKYKSTIENKKTDAVTWRQKEEAWNKLCEEYNSQAGEIPRNIKNLKIKYDGLKKTLKKKKAANQAKLFKTGGGGGIITPYTDYEEKLLSILGLQICGLADVDDSNSFSKNQLCANNSNDIEQNIESEDIFTMDENMATTSTVAKIIVTADSEQILIPTEEAISSIETSGGKNAENVNWIGWTPKQLRSPISTKLASSKRKPSSNHSVNEKYCNIAKRRMELVELQYHVAQQDVQLKELELKLKTQQYLNAVQENERLEEKHKLEIEKLKKQLQSCNSDV